MPARLSVPPLLSALSALIVVAPCAWAQTPPPTRDSPPFPTASATDSAAIRAAKSIQDAFIAVAHAAGPATVHILSVAPSVSVLESQEDNYGFDPLDARGGRRRESSVHGRLLGSGVIIRADGYILTNDHVVEDSPGGKVIVTLSDGSTFTGIVTRDKPTDLAIVKIDAGKPLPFVAMADSDNLAVGQWAIAIGSPFDQANTVTTGIVSALHRNRQIADSPSVGDRYYSDLIQTDAAINPGNSGGPLLNIDGALIGINVAILTRNGYNGGVSFAIPANTARRIADQLIARGKASHASLGVRPTDVPYFLRTRLGVAQGAYIMQVPLDTPAERAGIQPGDVITRFGTTDIGDEIALLAALGRAEPNSSVAITLLRAGKPQTVTVTLDDAAAHRTAPTASDDMALVSPAGLAKRQPANELGITTHPLTASNQDDFRQKAPVVGVYVGHVVVGSPASEAGLERGCAIVSVNGKPIATIEALNAALIAMHSGDVVTLGVLLAPTDAASAARGVVDILVP